MKSIILFQHHFFRQSYKIQQLLVVWLCEVADFDPKGVGFKLLTLGWNSMVLVHL